MAQFSFRLLQTFGTPRCKFRPSYDTSHSLYEPYSTLDCKNSKSIVKKNAGVKNKCYNIGLIQRRFWLAVIRANFHFLEQFKLFTQRIQIKQSCLAACLFLFSSNRYLSLDLGCRHSASAWKL